MPPDTPDLVMIAEPCHVSTLSSNLSVTFCPGPSSYAQSCRHVLSVSTTSFSRNLERVPFPFVPNTPDPCAASADLDVAGGGCVTCQRNGVGSGVVEAATYNTMVSAMPPPPHGAWYLQSSTGSAMAARNSPWPKSLNVTPEIPGSTISVGEDRQVCWKVPVGCSVWPTLVKGEVQRPCRRHS